VIRREVAIVGIGQTGYAKALPGTAWELAIEAILAALADAGVDPKDVSGWGLPVGAPGRPEGF